MRSRYIIIIGVIVALLVEVPFTVTQSTGGIDTSAPPAVGASSTVASATSSIVSTISSTEESFTHPGDIIVEEIGCTVELLDPADLQPDDVRLEEGKSLTANCSCVNITTSDEVVWFSPDDLRITTNWTENLSAEGSVLYITAAHLNLSGNYRCGIEALDMNTTMPLTVYIMPTYVMEGMIILGVNLALLVILLGCFLQSYVHEKQQIEKYGAIATKSFDR
jgi:hypothetical protein